MGADETVDVVDPDEDIGSDYAHTNRALRFAGNDTTTVATFSIKFYYTPEFAANTPDISGYIDQVVSVTNQGYANSGVPLVATAHCIEAATINDNTQNLFHSFMYMKGLKSKKTTSLCISNL